MHLIQRLDTTFRRLSALAILTLLVGTAAAQVTVTVANVSATVNQEVSIPINVSNVEAGAAVQAFQFTVSSSSASVEFVGVEKAGTLTESGWTVSGNPSNGRVGGFTSANGAFSTSGIMLYIKMRATASATATISLTGFLLNAGDPTHTPTIPTFCFSTTGSCGASNVPPVASNGAVTTSQGTAVQVTMTATDANANPLTYAIVSSPSNGSLGTVSGNKVTYTPNGGFTGTDSFTFKANDGTADSNTATVTITVNATGGGNNAPIANDDTYVVEEDASLFEAAPGVLSNDSDADGNSLTAVLETSPDNGSVSLGSNGAFSYVPNANYSGTDTFTYVANDGTVDSAPATVTITVTAVNDPPVASGSSVSTTAGNPVQITLQATDAEGDALTYTIVAPPQYGTVSTPSGNSVTYTPDSGYTGTDDFVFRANDGTSDSNQATINITISGNQAPVAAADSYTVEEDDVLSIPAPGVLSNDTDADGDPLTASIVNTTSNGTLTFGNTGGFFYEPDVDFYGEDSFTYQATDGIEFSSVVTVTITVTPTGSARVQVIHNAPDAAIDPANIYLDGQLFLLNAPFGDASPYVDHTDGTIEVAVAPGGTNIGSAVATFSATLEEDEIYLLIVGGTSSSGYELSVIDDGDEGTSSDRFEAFFFQGSPDLPTVDIVNVSDDLDNPGEVTILSGATFGDYTPYLPNVPDAYNFSVRTLGGSEVDVYRLDFSGGSSKSYAVVIHGLLSGGGYPVSMRAYDAAGNAINASIVTTLEPTSELVPKTFLLRGNYPNPFNPSTNIQFDLPEAAEVGIKVTDLLGRVMLSIPAQPLSAGTNLSIPVDASELASGIYIYRVEARAARELYLATGTMTLIK